MGSIGAALNKLDRQEAHAMRASSVASRSAMEAALSQQPASSMPPATASMPVQEEFAADESDAGGDVVAMSSHNHEQHITNPSTGVDADWIVCPDLTQDDPESLYITYVVEVNSNPDCVTSIRPGNAACICCW